MLENQKNSQAIENYNGIRNGDITAEFYENCDFIPDPKMLDPNLKNLRILKDKVNI